jgi:hypothetical protein
MCETAFGLIQIDECGCVDGYVGACVCVWGGGRGWVYASVWVCKEARWLA